MTYRDPNEALRAENEALQQQLKEAREEIEGMRMGADAREADADRQRWALGMRCLGGVALMLPFLLMTAVCERRFMPRYQHATMFRAQEMTVGAAPTVVPRPYVSHACRTRMAPAAGFEHFTRSIERSARVTAAENAPGIQEGTPCTLRVIPVSMLDFNCHVEVVCAGQTVYGSLPTGYAHCDVDHAAVLRATDAEHTAADGDPAINIDLPSHRGMVVDTVHGATRRIALAIDTPPSLD